jgi:hypothetical protein
MIIYKCDKCGKRGWSKIGFYKLNWLHLSLNYGSEYDDYHFCPKCSEKVKDYLKRYSKKVKL